MVFIEKATQQENLPSTSSAVTKSPPSEPLLPLDETMRRIKALVDRNNYQKALEVIPASNSKPELRNARAVCLMRLHDFPTAVQVFRTFALTEYSQTMKANLPEYMKVNFAIALFFGGQPAGGWAAMNELETTRDDQILIVREACRNWIAGFGFFKRLDWKLNKIAPESLPPIPVEPLGRFGWEPTSSILVS
jgi:hypothetical protein